jgi:peroxiredoxin|tara:strand:+ start:878 stop:1015 length:138 start_codon:yes stop_codon:yes gene_type:complete
MIIKKGSLAPDFNLTDQNGEKITLSQYKGDKDVILSWHIFDFTGG